MITHLIFFLLIQETLVVIMVGLRFNNPLAPSIIVCSVLYLVMLLFFLVTTFWEPAWFFPNKHTQYICWWRKIGLPVMVIVPLYVTYLLVIFLVFFVILESFFDMKGKDFKLKSRVTLFKFVELLLIIFCAIYVGVEFNIKALISTEIINVMFSIIIIVLYLCLIIEIAFGIK